MGIYTGIDRAAAKFADEATVGETRVRADDGTVGVIEGVRWSRTAYVVRGTTYPYEDLTIIDA